MSEYAIQNFIHAGYTVPKLLSFSFATRKFINTEFHYDEFNYCFFCTESTETTRQKINAIAISKRPLAFGYWIIQPTSYKLCLKKSLNGTHTEEFTYTFKLRSIRWKVYFPGTTETNLSNRLSSSIRIYLYLENEFGNLNKVWSILLKKKQQPLQKSLQPQINTSICLPQTEPISQHSDAKSFVETQSDIQKESNLIQETDSNLNDQTNQIDCNFIANFKWICENTYIFDSFKDKWIVVYNQKVEILDVTCLDEAFDLIRKINFPFGAIVLDTSFKVSSLQCYNKKISLSDSDEHIRIDMKFGNDNNIIDNMIFDTGASITTVNYDRNHKIFEGIFDGNNKYYWSFIPLQTVNGPSLNIVVDSYEIAIKELNFQKAQICFPLGYRLFHAILCEFNYIKKIQPTTLEVKLKEYDNKFNDNFFFRMDEFLLYHGSSKPMEYWLNEYYLPDGHLKESIDMCIMNREFNMQGLIGWNYIRKINFTYDANKQEMIFTDNENQRKSSQLEQINSPHQQALDRQESVSREQNIQRNNFAEDVSIYIFFIFNIQRNRKDLCLKLPKYAD